MSLALLSGKGFVSQRGHASWLARAFWLACVLASAWGTTNGAHAQLHRATDSVATPASSVVLLDDALSLDVNPAAIGRLPAYSVALLHSDVDQSGSWLARGDALYVAAPVFGPLALGATVQSIRPDRLALRPFGDSGPVDRAMAAFSLAISPGERFSVGLTTRTFSSSNAHFDGLTALDFGMLVRPSSWLGISLVGRDLFISRSGFGTGELDLGSSVMGSVALRPFGSDALTFDFDLVMDASDSSRLSGRGGVVIDLPYVGTASGLIEAPELADARSALRIVAELAINLGSMSAVGGLAEGDGIESGTNWYAMLRADGKQRVGVPLRARVVDLEVGDLSSRSMLSLALTLEQARTDDRVAGILLRPRSTGMGLAYAQEIRLQIASLRRAGKPVVCHLNSASGAEYYACAGANRVLIDPAGDVRLMGVATTVMLFGEVLQKIGVRADFVRIGTFKSAPEQFTQAELGAAAREETNALLDDSHRRMLADLAVDLRATQAHVADLIDAGPFLAHAAVKAGLVADASDEHELDDDLKQVFEDRRVDRSMPEDQSRRWGKQAAIGVVVVDDEIVDGESFELPFIGMHSTGGATVVRELASMADDPNIRAIILRVDSPGGAALASDQVWRAVRRARKKKPVVASMGAVAASGGYYVAAAADEIWADPSTLTGSIGIFYGKVDVEGLANILGIHIENFGRGKRAGADSIYRPFTDEERAALSDAMRTYYRLFLSRVAEGRGMSIEAVDALARGRIHSGDAAQRVGLVDRLGGFASALVRARELAGLGADSDVIVRPLRKNGLIDYVLGGSVLASALTVSGSAEAQAEPMHVPTQLRSLLRAVTTLQTLGTGEPLALLPFDAAF